MLPVRLASPVGICTPPRTAHGPWALAFDQPPASAGEAAGNWEKARCCQNAVNRLPAGFPSHLRLPSGARPSLACWGSPATVWIRSSSFAQVRRSAICSGSSPPFGQAAPHFLWVLSFGPSQLSSFCWVHLSNTLGSRIHSRPARTGPQRPTTLHLTELSPRPNSSCPRSIPPSHPLVATTARYHPLLPEQHLSSRIAQRPFAPRRPSLGSPQDHWASLHTLRGPAFEPRQRTWTSPPHSISPHSFPQFPTRLLPSRSSVSPPFQLKPRELLVLAGYILAPAKQLLSCLSAGLRRTYHTTFPSGVVISLPPRPRQSATSQSS